MSWKLSYRQGFGVGFNPLVSRDQRLMQMAFLGAWGGGKTYPAVIRTLLFAIQTPHDEVKYGPIRGRIGGPKNTPPVTLVTAVTATDAMETVGKQMLAIARDLSPRQTIIKNVARGNSPRISLVNGHEIRFASAQGSIEGPSVSQLMVDEVADPIYHKAHSKTGKTVMDNLMGRVRDKHADRWSIVLAGLAIKGHTEKYCRVWRQATAKDWDDVDARHRIRNRRTDKIWREGRKAYVLLGPEDNPALRDTSYGDDVSAASMRTDADGWLEMAGASFGDFSIARHVRIPPELAGITLDAVKKGQLGPIVLGYDAMGRSSRHDARTGASLVVMLPYRRTDGRQGVLVVDEFHLMDQIGTEQVFGRFHADGFGRGRYQGGVAMICIDPSLSADTIQAIRVKYPSTRIVQLKTGPYLKETTGVEAIQTALLAHSGVTRLFFAPWLQSDTTGRGLVTAVPAYRVGERTAQSHGVDALRYGVQVLLPLADRPTEQTQTATGYGRRRIRESRML